MSPVITNQPFTITSVMDGLVALENEVSEAVDGELAVCRWRPRTPDLEQGGMIYNYLETSPHTQQAVDVEEDFVTILARVGIRHSDVDDEMAVIERYMAAFIDIVDPALKRVHPLRTNIVKRAWRTGLRMLEDEFNPGAPSIYVLAVEFPIQVTFNRVIYANS